ncbi:hypothetical protein [Streptomyces sp. NBC_01187]|uniref:hypothetical protein n=1 Tax=Streptomyces sp. NBC_01187 TaxID=2903766 RepID=UPI003867D3FE|nr:hypothetical protein OG220_11575 [Streptomyces sp. NBC_01187]
MTLPRTYWCHVDYTNPEGLRFAPRSETMSDPDRAVCWLREAARDIAFTLDHDIFGMVWAWLGDHRGADDALAALRCDQPYTFRFGRDEHEWTLLARPVSLLPLARTCPTAEEEKTTQDGAWGVGP